MTHLINFVVREQMEEVVKECGISKDAMRQITQNIGASEELMRPVGSFISSDLACNIEESLAKDGLVQKPERRNTDGFLDF